MIFSFSSMQMQAFLKIAVINDATQSQAETYEYPVISAGELIELQKQRMNN